MIDGPLYNIFYEGKYAVQKENYVVNCLIVEQKRDEAINE